MWCSTCGGDARICGICPLDGSVLASIRGEDRPDEVVRRFEEKYGKMMRWEMAHYRQELMCFAVEFDRPQLVELLLERRFPVNFGSFWSRVQRDGRLVYFDRRTGKERDEGPSRRESQHWSSMFFSSALELAIIVDRPHLMGLLAKHHDRAKDCKNRSTLQLACLHGAFRCLERLLTDTKVLEEDLNATDYLRCPHPTQSMRIFDDNKGNQDPSCTPLTLALRHGCRFVRRLLDAGASATAVGTSGRTALHGAIEFCTDGNDVVDDLPEIIELLLDAGCDANAVAFEDGLEMTALSLMCANVFRAPNDAQHR